jgi:hypothetical protein
MALVIKSGVRDDGKAEDEQQGRTYKRPRDKYSDPEWQQSNLRCDELLWRSMVVIRHIKPYNDGVPRLGGGFIVDYDRKQRVACIVSSHKAIAKLDWGLCYVDIPGIHLVDRRLLRPMLRCPEHNVAFLAISITEQDLQGAKKPPILVVAGSPKFNPYETHLSIAYRQLTPDPPTYDSKIFRGVFLDWERDPSAVHYIEEWLDTSPTRTRNDTRIKRVDNYGRPLLEFNGKNVVSGTPIINEEGEVIGIWSTQSQTTGLIVIESVDKICRQRLPAFWKEIEGDRQ